MGHGSDKYRPGRGRRWGRISLYVLLTTLYLAFAADCMILIAMMAKNAGPNASAEPTGGGSLIVILLLIAGVRRILFGPSEDYIGY